MALPEYKTMSLVCYWDLVEMKYLNMGHKVTMVSKVPITKHIKHNVPDFCGLDIKDTLKERRELS